MPFTKSSVTLRSAQPVVTRQRSQPAPVVQVLSAMELQVSIVHMCLHLRQVNGTTRVNTADNGLCYMDEVSSATSA